MLILLFATSFLASAALTLFLRRLDKKSAVISQVKRISDMAADRISELAETRTQNIKDAALEFELLIRQSRQVEADLRTGLSAYQSRMQSLNEDRALVENISGELSAIARTATNVSIEVDRLDQGLARLGLASREISEIERNVQTLHVSIEQKGADADARLGTVISKLVNETEERTRALTDQVRGSFNILKDEIRETRGRMDEYGRDAEILAERLQSIAARIEDKWSLESGRIEDRFGAVERKLLERVGQLDAGLSQIRSSAVEALQGDVARIRSEIEGFSIETMTGRDEILNEARRMAEGISDQINLFQEKYLTAENRLLKHAEEQKASLSRRLEAFEAEWAAIEDKRFTSVSAQITGLETEIAAVREKQVQSLSLEVDRARDDIAAMKENLNLTAQDLRASVMETLTREVDKARGDMIEMRDNLNLTAHEVRSSTRVEGEDAVMRIREARKIEEDYLARGRKELDGLFDELQEAARKIHESRDEVVEHLSRKAAKFMQDQDEQLERLDRTYEEKISRRVEEMDRESARIREIEARFEKLDRAEDLVARLDETIEVLSDRLRLAKEENSRMDEYVRHFESLRVSRKEVEAELKAIEAQRERLTGAEDTLAKVDKELSRITDRIAFIEKGDEIAANIESRIEQLNELEAGFAKYASDLAEKERFLQNSVRAIEKARAEVANARESAERITGKVERTQLRQDEVAKHISDLETRARDLTKLESHIQKVETRFEQMDGLMADLEGRQKQVHNMTRRMDEIKTQGDEVKVELQSIIHEADEKMDRLTAFYETVEKLLDSALDAETRELAASTPAARGGRKNAKAGSVAEWKRDSILSLYLNHKWDADLIAQRMKIDPAVVRAVIGSHAG